MIAESQVTNLTTDLASLQTQTALQAAQLATRANADLGYYCYSALAGLLVANATPTKLNMGAGTLLFSDGTTPTEVNCAAQTAISTTIASLADATNPKWVLVEINSSASINFNQGTAAVAPAFPMP